MWGYDQAFLEACRRELSLSRRDLEETQVAVAEENGEIVGVVQVKVSSGEAELLKLFIEPHALRSGTGRILFAWAAEVSRDEGATQMVIEADPDAAPFYSRLGARATGEVPSGSIPGRLLPRLTFDL
ncbi:GNAT family N-acetyltransferase [Bradyrhizobium sp. CAR08]